MAAERAKRTNAGSLMEKLIGDEKDKEEDEFWAEHGDYFNSSEDDGEFDSDDSDLGENEKVDSEDSDIDDDENAMTQGDAEAAAEEEKRAKKAAKAPARRSGAYKDPALKYRRKVVMAPGTTKKRAYYDLAPTEPLAARREKRASVAASDEARAERKQKEDQKPKVQRQAVVAERKLSAQEMFAEAARTELINKASLERLLRLEEDKRKEIVRKRNVGGPRIRYHSRIVAQKNATGTQIDSSRKSVETITFTEVASVPLSLANNQGSQLQYRRNRAKVCPVTNLPAKYLDPLTKTPYATLAAFKQIREKYKQQQEAATAKAKAKLEEGLK